MKSHLSRTVAAVYDRRIFHSQWKIYFSTFLAFLLVNPICTAQIQQAWVAKYKNGITNGTHQAVKMSLDTNGSIYVTGFSQNTNGNYGYATIKYAPNGNQLWVARYDSTNYPAAQPTGLAVDHQGNTVVTGSAVTGKYDSKGNHLWTLLYNGAGVALDSSNNVCITGVASNYTTMKFTAGGTNLWTQTFTSAGPCGAQTINIGPSDAIYVSGYQFYVYEPLAHGVRVCAIKYDSVGTQLWWAGDTEGGSQGYADVQDAKVDNVGNLYFVMNYDNYGSSGQFLTYCYSSAGVSSWEALNPTSNGGSTVHSLVLDAAGNVVITGQKHDNFDYGVAYGTYKINTNGSFVWTNTYPNLPSGISVAMAITIDQRNSVYVTGYSPGTNSGNDIVTIKYDNNGKQIWLQRYNGPGNGDDEGNAIAVDASGNVYVEPVPDGRTRGWRRECLDSKRMKSAHDEEIMSLCWRAP